MDEMPRDSGPDSTLAFAREGYRYISNQCERLGSDVFVTRFLFRPTICLRGREAAELFYDESRFQRAGASPKRVQKTLFGVGGVQGLDDEAHRHHKAMLMSIMGPDRVRELADQVGRVWRDRLDAWERAGRVVLYEEVGRILTRAVCDWAGVPLADAEVRRRTDDLHALVEAPAAVGPRYQRGRRARKRTEAWAGHLVDRVRRGDLTAPPESAVRVIAEHRDLAGRPLDRHVAAVALLNVLRPTVAVDRFVTFAALALHQHPQWHDRVRSGAEVEPFVQEVRRFYPFFPFVGARVRRSFDWQGHHFPKGRRVLLDLYGTDHHPKFWTEPDEFHPERFHTWDGDPFSFVPQGGGDQWQGHRCAGEQATVEIMKVALDVLTNAIEYAVPDQDLRVFLRRVPAIPVSRFVVAGVRRLP